VGVVPQARPPGSPRSFVDTFVRAAGPPLAGTHETLGFFGPNFIESLSQAMGHP